MLGGQLAYEFAGSRKFKMDDGAAGPQYMEQIGEKLIDLDSIVERK